MNKKHLPCIDQTLASMPADEFNALYAVGTAVDWFPVIRPGEAFRQTKTRSIAYELGDGHVSVKVDGVSGTVPLRSLRLSQPA